MAKAKDMGRWMAERTIDAQRASATVRAGVRRAGHPTAAQESLPPSCGVAPRTCSRAACCRWTEPLPAGSMTHGAPSHTSAPTHPHSGPPHPVRAQVPRDTVQLYAQLAQSGLQYGPAFRLLRNVHVPDTN